MSVEAFFQCEPPSYLNALASKVQEFVNHHKEQGTRVVLVTSGGTTVPLESQTVRFIDNFSAGTRGATSAEYFLESGYAVIFMHRQFSLQPYSRFFTHSKNCFLDYMTLSKKDEQATATNDDDDNNKVVTVDKNWSSTMKPVLERYQYAKNKNLLCMIHFVTVKDYLFLLRKVTQILDVLKENALFYLAAAVSDFYIPDDKMVQHKIQSDDGPLTLTLERVPKMLYPLVKEWAPHAFIVSFKLETDTALLIPKAKASLSRYGHQIVIGNILNTRKHHVVFVLRQDDKQEDINLTPKQISNGVEIESLIIQKLKEYHEAFIRSSSSDVATNT